MFGVGWGVIHWGSFKSKGQSNQRKQYYTFHSHLQCWALTSSVDYHFNHVCQLNLSRKWSKGEQEVNVINEITDKKTEVNPIRWPFNLLTPVLAATGHDKHWPLFHFQHHDLWSKLPIIYTRVLREEKIFPMIPRSDWVAQWSLRYAWKCWEISLKNVGQNFLQKAPGVNWLCVSQFQQCLSPMG